MVMPYVTLPFVSRMEDTDSLPFMNLLFPAFSTYAQQKEAHQFLIYWEREFVHYLNGKLNLYFESFVMGNTKIANVGHFVCTFSSVKNKQ